MRPGGTSSAEAGAGAARLAKAQPGKPAEPSMLVNVARLVSAYYAQKPDPSIAGQRVVFGTSGHRGCAFEVSFNEAHILAITRAICLYRRRRGITGPLFLGTDTHALSEPAFVTALEVLAANGVEVMIDRERGYTPTPVISHAIIAYNRRRRGRGLADGIVITPSHNPPEDGGFKYNPPHGGPAEAGITDWIETAANALLAARRPRIARLPFSRAINAPTTHRYDYSKRYLADLGSVVDMDAIRAAGLRIGADPLGGASVAYWASIAERYRIPLTLVNGQVDPTFRFMMLDRDGRIRMDCSSPYAMAGLVAMRKRFDLAVATDTDADRHGIVTRSAGLLDPNHFLAAAIFYLFSRRERWAPTAAVGKTVVSSSIIDRVAARLGRRLVEVPVGFKWFVDGLLDGRLGFAGEESAGASLLRADSTVWTTDKDGIVMGLLAAEMTAVTGRDPGELYRQLTRELGAPVYRRIDAPASPAEKELLKRLAPERIGAQRLAGDKVRAVLTRAPGNNQPIGGIKVVTDNGWFAVRPSGTEPLYKLYAESFRGRSHLRRIEEEAQALIADALSGAGPGQGNPGASHG